MKTSPVALCVLALGMFLVLLLASAALGDETVLHGRVVCVIDGDTIWVLVAEKQLEIRLAFFDAPEKKQAFGARAKQAMSELVFAKDIELRKQAIDRYGRTVAQVSVEGKDVGEEMLRQGLAWVYERYITEASTAIQGPYRKSQEEAKTKKLGLWSDPNPIPPWKFRHPKAHQKQVIASVQAYQKSSDLNTVDARLALPNLSDSPLHVEDVWVNMKSGKYWKPGSAYYHKTKRGEYMPEKEAVQSGYIPANGTGD